MKTLVGIGAAFALVSVAAPAAAPAAPLARTYLVSPACGGQPLPCYTAIQPALDAAERDLSGQWIEIRLSAGDYREKPVVRRSRLRLVGSGPARTRIHFGAVAQTAGRFHRANWGTPGSATLTIDAADVTITGLTIENTFDYLANDRRDPGDAAKIANPQGVALLLDIHSDRVAVDDAAILGYQDTLFANGGRAVIRNSLVAGNIDFIFGDGQLLIETSEVRSRNRSAGIAAGEFHSFIAAPSTPLAQPIGIVFNKVRLTRENGVPDGSVALARPWHPTRRFADGRYADPNAVGQAIFIDCIMGAHIHPDHWAPMNGTARDGTMSNVFHPQQSRFAEKGSTGPGARVRDIGMTWSDIKNIEDIYRHMFGDWNITQHRHPPRHRTA